LFYYIQSWLGLSAELAPFTSLLLAYSIASLSSVLVYVRKMYMKPDYRTCLGCPMYRFCSMLVAKRLIKQSKLYRMPSNNEVEKIVLTVIILYLIIITPLISRVFSMRNTIEILAQVVAAIISSLAILTISIMVLENF